MGDGTIKQAHIGAGGSAISGKRIIYLGLGCLALVMATLGAAIPLLPTVPFLLAAAFCFAQSSAKLHTFLVNSKFYQKNLESFAQGRGMTRRAKVHILLVLTATLGLGFYLMANAPLGRVLVAFIWLCHLLYFLWGVKTLP